MYGNVPSSIPGCVRVACDRVVTSLNEQFAKNVAAETTGLQGHAEAVADTALKAKLEEAREVIEKRHAVTTNFISDWKKLAAATNSFSVQADAAFSQGNKGLCAQVDKGVQGKSTIEIMQTCTKSFETAKKEVEDKLKELEDAVGGSGDAAPAE